MTNTTLERVRAEALALPGADRLELIRQLTRSLGADGAAPDRVSPDRVSTYEQRLRRYADDAWHRLGATLSVRARS